MSINEGNNQVTVTIYLMLMTVKIIIFGILQVVVAFDGVGTIG